MGNLYAATPGQSPGVARIYSIYSIYIYIYIYFFLFPSWIVCGTCQCEKPPLAQFFLFEPGAFSKTLVSRLVRPGRLTVENQNFRQDLQEVEMSYDVEGTDGGSAEWRSSKQGA